MTKTAKRCPSPDWPYEDDLPMFLPGPGYYWECPDGTCECRPVEEGEPRQLTVLLCDELARPIPYARCRVLHAGRVLNEGTPHADAEGWLNVTVTRPLRTVTLEWAPPDTPLAPRFPFRWRYHVDLEEEASDKHAIARRLHNIGFSQRGVLAENVKDFQRAFGYERITGEVKDIREDLLLFHDRGWIPPIENNREEEEDEDDEQTEKDQGISVPFQAFPGATAQAKPKPHKEPKPKAAPVPRPEKPKQHKPAGPPGTGTARPAQKGTLVLHVCCQFATLDGKGRVQRRCRWDNEEKNPHPVSKASIELFDMQGNVVAAFAQANRSHKTNTVETDVTGQREIKLGSIPDGEYVLRLNPPAGQELRGPKPGPITAEADLEKQLRSVGPEDNFPNDGPGHTRFRILEIAITLKSGTLQGATIVPSMKRPGDVAFHGVVVDKNPSLLKIDWKPDWVRCSFMKGPKTGQPDPRTRTPLKKAHFIVLHHTNSDTPGSAINEFLSPRNKEETGAHYIVDVDGHVTKLADESIHVRHAGECFWHGLDSHKGSAMGRANFNWNDISIGIEQVHRESTEYKSEQIAGTKNLMERVRKLHGTSHHNVLGHAEIALHESSKPKRLGRKLRCPGDPYPWPILERSGNATAPGSATVPHVRYAGFLKNQHAIIGKRAPRAAIGGLQLTLSELGYFVNATLQYDEATIRAVEAFHNRYFSGERRPTGPTGAKTIKSVADIESIEMMHKVLASRGTFIF